MLLQRAHPRPSPCLRLPAALSAQRRSSPLLDCSEGGMRTCAGVLVYSLVVRSWHNVTRCSDVPQRNGKRSRLSWHSGWQRTCASGVWSSQSAFEEASRIAFDWSSVFGLKVHSGPSCGACHAQAQVFKYCLARQDTSRPCCAGKNLGRSNRLGSHHLQRYSALCAQGHDM